MTNKFDRTSQDISINENGRNNANYLLERSSLFGANDNETMDEDNNSCNKSIDENELEMTKGMPLRTSNKTKLNINKKNLNILNNHLDFNVYDDDYDKTKFNDVEDNDNADHNLFSSIINQNQNDSTLLIKGVDNLCSMSSNRFSWLIYNKISENIKISFCVSPLSLYIMLACLYLCSKNQTEINLKNMCGFPDKNILYEGLHELFETKKNVLVLVNILFINSSIQINPVYSKYISNVLMIDTINNNLVKSKIDNINIWFDDFIHPKSNNISKNIITKDMLYNKTSQSINFICIKSNKYKNKNNIIINKQFNGYNGYNRIVPMIQKFDISVYYYEDSMVRAIETKYDSNYNIGFIMSKNTDNSKYNITIKYIDEIIKNYDGIVIEEIMVPKFKHENKYQFKNLLNTIGIFDVTELYELCEKNINLDNIIQYCNFTLSDILRVEQYNINFKKERSVRFIADKPFTYYIRNNIKNNYILIGSFT